MSMTSKDKFRVVIRTPEEEVVSREVESIYLTTEEGDMMLMPGHAALSGSITYSPVILKDEDHEEEYIVRRGIVFYSNAKNEAHILCQQAELKDKVDYDGLKAYLKMVEEHIARGESLSDIHMRFLEGQKLALVEEIEAKER